jgi:hypothetical protein
MVKGSSSFLVRSKTRALQCLIQGDNAVFEVEMDGNEQIHQLKEAIHRKGIDTMKLPILAKDLILLKVTRISRSA